MHTIYEITEYKYIIIVAILLFYIYSNLHTQTIQMTGHIWSTIKRSLWHGPMDLEQLKKV